MDETDKDLYVDDPEYVRVHRAGTVWYLVKNFGNPKKKKKKKRERVKPKKIVYDYSSLLQGNPDLLEREERISNKRKKEYAERCRRQQLRLLRKREGR
jgi:hypothetical protein